MGLFGFGKKKNDAVTQNTVNTQATDAATPVNTIGGKVNLSKEDRVHRVNLRKEQIGQYCAGVGVLNGAKARVGLVLDYSGSMSKLYRNGTIQEVIEQMLPLAMNFDDDGNMETWLFDDEFHRLPDINLNNFYGYIEREAKYSMGCTQYAPVMADVEKKYMQEAPANLPNYIIFITDGDNSDHSQAERFIKNVSDKPIFWQFVGVGDSSFNFLEKLDEMDGRYIDNANFFKVGKPEDITYEKLLAEFPSWLSNSKVQAMLR